MKPIEECRTVAELLEDPKRWTQGGIARREDGSLIMHPEDSEACAWCIYGALRIVYRDSNERTNATQTLMDTGGLESLVGWNDDPARTHAEVLELVRKAGI